MSKACQNCGKQDRLAACRACGKAQYCSVECQKTDWKFHKEHCKIGLVTKPPSDVLPKAPEVVSPTASKDQPIPATKPFVIPRATKPSKFASERLVRDVLKLHISKCKTKTNTLKQLIMARILEQGHSAAKQNLLLAHLDKTNTLVDALTMKSAKKEDLNQFLMQYAKLLGVSLKPRSPSDDDAVEIIKMDTIETIHQEFLDSPSPPFKNVPSAPASKDFRKRVESLCPDIPLDGRKHFVSSYPDLISVSATEFNAVQNNEREMLINEAFQTYSQAKEKLVKYWGRKNSNVGMLGHNPVHSTRGTTNRKAEDLDKRLEELRAKKVALELDLVPLKSELKKLEDKPGDLDDAETDQFNDLGLNVLAKQRELDTVIRDITALTAEMPVLENMVSENLFPGFVEIAEASGIGRKAAFIPFIVALFLFVAGYAFISDTMKPPVLPPSIQKSVYVSHFSDLQLVNKTYTENKIKYEEYQMQKMDILASTIEQKHARLNQLYEDAGLNDMILQEMVWKRINRQRKVRLAQMRGEPIPEGPTKQGITADFLTKPEYRRRLLDLLQAAVSIEFSKFQDTALYQFSPEDAADIFASYGMDLEEREAKNLALEYAQTIGKTAASPVANKMQTTGQVALMPVLGAQLNKFVNSNHFRNVETHRKMLYQLERILERKEEDIIKIWKFGQEITDEIGVAAKKLIADYTAFTKTHASALDYGIFIEALLQSIDDVLPYGDLMQNALDLEMLGGTEPTFFTMENAKNPAKHKQYISAYKKIYLSPRFANFYSYKWTNEGVEVLRALESLKLLQDATKAKFRVPLPELGSPEFEAISLELRQNVVKNLQAYRQYSEKILQKYEGSTKRSELEAETYSAIYVLTVAFDTVAQTSAGSWTMGISAILDTIAITAGLGTLLQMKDKIGSVEAYTKLIAIGFITAFRLITSGYATYGVYHLLETLFYMSKTSSYVMNGVLGVAGVTAASFLAGLPTTKDFLDFVGVHIFSTSQALKERIVDVSLLARRLNQGRAVGFCLLLLAAQAETGGFLPSYTRRIAIEQLTTVHETVADFPDYDNITKTLDVVGLKQLLPALKHRQILESQSEMGRDMASHALTWLRSETATSLRELDTAKDIDPKLIELMRNFNYTRRTPDQLMQEITKLRETLAQYASKGYPFSEGEEEDFPYALPAPPRQGLLPEPPSETETIIVPELPTEETLPESQVPSNEQSSWWRTTTPDFDLPKSQNVPKESASWWPF